MAGGRFAKKVGQGFEDRFMAYCNSQPDATAVRIPDGCIQVGAYKLIRTTTPFDFVCGYKDKTFFCDTKTTQSISFPLIEKTYKNQIRSFEALAKHGAITGYLVEFRTQNEFRWFNLNTIKKILLMRKSLPFEQGIIVGSGFPMTIDFTKILESA